MNTKQTSALASSLIAAILLSSPLAHGKLCGVYDYKTVGLRGETEVHSNIVGDAVEMVSCTRAYFAPETRDTIPFRCKVVARFSKAQFRHLHGKAERVGRLQHLRELVSVANGMGSGAFGGGMVVAIGTMGGTVAANTIAVLPGQRMAPLELARFGAAAGASLSIPIGFSGPFFGAYTGRRISQTVGESQARAQAILAVAAHPEMFESASSSCKFSEPEKRFDLDEAILALPEILEDPKYQQDEMDLDRIFDRALREQAVITSLSIWGPAGAGAADIITGSLPGLSDRSLIRNIDREGLLSETPLPEAVKAQPQSAIAE